MTSTLFMLKQVIQNLRYESSPLFFDNFFLLWCPGRLFIIYEIYHRGKVYVNKKVLTLGSVWNGWPQTAAENVFHPWAAPHRRCLLAAATSGRWSVPPPGRRCPCLSPAPSHGLWPWAATLATPRWRSRRRAAGTTLFVGRRGGVLAFRL